MSGLVSRAAEDQQRRVQQRLDQLERNTGLGFALPFTPFVRMATTPCTQHVDNSGMWIRHNDLLVFWFVIYIDATVGTGLLTIDVPDGLFLDDFQAVPQYVGRWQGSINTKSAEGWLMPKTGQEDRIQPWYQQSSPFDFSAQLTHSNTYAGGTFTLGAGDWISGQVVGSLADP